MDEELLDGLLTTWWEGRGRGLMGDRVAALVAQPWVPVSYGCQRGDRAGFVAECVARAGVSEEEAGVAFYYLAARAGDWPESGRGGGS